MAMNFKTLAALCAISMAMSGCTNEDGDVIDTSSPLLEENLAEPSEDMDSVPVFSVVSPSDADCTMEFSADSVSINGSGAQAQGSIVTITKPGIYTVSGNCGSGKIIVAADKEDEVVLVLNGLALTSDDNSVIECTSGKTLVLCVTDGTENSLSDGSSYHFAEGEDEPDGAIFSRADLVITGGGRLTVTGNYKDGIKCKDGLSIEQGTIDVTAADDGIVGKDYVSVCGGNVTVNAGGDGIKSTNNTDSGRGYIKISDGTVDITSEKDGIQAETSLTVSGGEIQITAGGGDIGTSGIVSGSPFDWDNSSNSESKKGLKAGGDIKIGGGQTSVTIQSADDSIHSNANAAISGGTLMLSSGDDGIHAEENLEISGGKITITKSYEGLEGKNIDISGGEINIKASDDGINAAGGDNGAYFGYNSDNGDYYISISGGEITVDSGGDGIDSNGTIAQSGGIVTVFGPTGGGNSALDYDRSFAVSGGTLTALGCRDMAQAPSTLSQPCLSIYANVDAGSLIEVKDSSGNALISVTSAKACQSLIFTSDMFKPNEEYKIYSDGILLESVTATDGVAGGGASGTGNMGGHSGKQPNTGFNNGGNFGGIKPDDREHAIPFPF